MPAGGEDAMDGGGHDGGGHSAGHDGAHDGYGGHGGHSGSDMAHIERVAVDTVDRAMNVLSGLLDAVGGADAALPGDHAGRDRDRALAAAADRVASGLRGVSGRPRSADRVTAAQERALALWRRTCDREREMGALLWLAEYHALAAGRARHGAQAEGLARATGDPLRIAQALRARGEGLSVASTTRDEAVALLLAAAESAREALRAPEHLADRTRLKDLISRCGKSAVDALMRANRSADAAAVCARFIAEGADSFSFWSRYESARERDAAGRELGAERQAAEEAAAGRPAEAAARWRYAAAVAWQDRGDRPAALTRLRRAQEHARLAGDAVSPEDTAELTELASRIRTVTWSRPAFQAHRHAVDRHKQHHDADAAWQALVSARTVAGARTALSRWANPRAVRFY
jgi:hypothetical protein